MKTTILEETPNSIKFRLDGVDYTFANALRRVAINSVKCFAIDTVTFYENSSAMFDEYIAHRIGLVPILTPKGSKDDDAVLFKLEAEGPATVYSKDLESTDRYVKVANEKIPIIKLAEGQRIRLEGKAVLGSASKSAKFQPGLVSYRQLADDQFEFYIETFGQMEAKEILNRALENINEGLKTIGKHLKK
ncbi:MAG: DNA-directed RNA polymerase subunit D [Candidatus Micrarchaeaceae archaeon]